MIKLCGIKMEISHFPDHTQCIRIPLEILEKEKYIIEWNYEGDEEMATLLYIVKHLGNAKKKELILPYIPNARMDRVKNPDEVFTLKYFCEFINDLKFDTVYVEDPHSDVSTALINNVKVGLFTYRNIYDVLKKINYNSDNNRIVIFYPDNGAAKRYGNAIKLPFCYGLKNRDWRTGEILGLDVVTNGIELAGKNVLIVDDICSKGGTFYYSALKLREYGVKDIYLYVTHCENTIKEGELLKDNGLIKKIFTTDSIYSLDEEKVEVLKNV